MCQIWYESINSIKSRILQYPTNASQHMAGCVKTKRVSWNSPLWRNNGGILGHKPHESLEYIKVSPTFAEL